MENKPPGSGRKSKAQSPELHPRTAHKGPHEPFKLSSSSNGHAVEHPSNNLPVLKNFFKNLDDYLKKQELKRIQRAFIKQRLAVSSQGLLGKQATDTEPLDSAISESGDGTAIKSRVPPGYRMADEGAPHDVDYHYIREMAAAILLAKSNEILATANTIEDQDGQSDMGAKGESDPEYRSEARVLELQDESDEKLSTEDSGDSLDSPSVDDDDRELDLDYED